MSGLVQSLHRSASDYVEGAYCSVCGRRLDLIKKEELYFCEDAKRCFERGLAGCTTEEQLRSVQNRLSGVFYETSLFRYLSSTNQGSIPFSNDPVTKAPTSAPSAPPSVLSPRPSYVSSPPLTPRPTPRISVEMPRISRPVAAHKPLGDKLYEYLEKFKLTRYPERIYPWIRVEDVGNRSVAFIGTALFKESGVFSSIDSDVDGTYISLRANAKRLLLDESGEKCMISVVEEGIEWSMKAVLYREGMLVRYWVRSRDEQGESGKTDFVYVLMQDKTPIEISESKFEGLLAKIPR